MNRKETTEYLSRLLEKHLHTKDPRVYWAKEVTFDYSSACPIRVDYMRFKPLNNTISGIEKGDFYCYEIKSCVEDFRSKNGHNFIGDYNYYIMTKETYGEVAKEIPWDVGVYLEECGELVSVKNARRKERNRPLSEMLLMMFRSNARGCRRLTAN